MRAVPLRCTVLLLAGALPCLATAVSVHVDPPVPKAGEPFTLMLTIQDAVVDKIELPAIDGLQSHPGMGSITYAFTSGALITTTVRRWQLIASQGGDFTIPSIDVSLKNGTVLETQPVKIHVADNDDTPGSAPLPAAALVVMPPANPTPPAPPPIPRDADGSPAKVFMLLAVQTTDAYVGEMVPIRIDFYIRQESDADQDSLPTIKGSNFLMNDFIVRGHASMAVLENVPYECDTWLTAIAAPKSGDFPLAAERDTYWMKSVTPNGFDSLGFTTKTNLAHGMITSNQLMMHVRPLPDEGRPAHFSGAVGQFAVSSDAQPATVAMGEPVTLTYAIQGTGNFDYVRCPVLEDDSHWKAYAPTSTTNYANGDETRTTATKTFEQSLIPQENGNVPLPSASFSYFDPALRRYMIVPIHFASVAVTGAMPLPAAASPAAPEETAASTPSGASDFLPNRADLGELRTSLVPVYRAPWFWPVQGALAALPLLGLAIFLVRRLARAGNETTESVSRRRSLRQEEAAMAQAVRQGDARAFFLSARHAVQLQLGTQWGVAPEALTLGEIRRRDPALAETLGPLFAQADDVIYSGRSAANADLAHWQRVALEFLRLQPA
jgi:hypothetical protein